MTTEQTEAVLRWLKEFKSKCPVCQAVGPSHYFNEFFNLSQVCPARATNAGSNPPLVGLTCRTCGYLWLVDASVARILDQEK
jgi:hypothetical protein